MRISQQTSQRQARTQRINPRSIAAGLILQMPTEELLLRIEEEIATNPALEVNWNETCPDCGRGLSHGICWSCRSQRQPDATAESSYEPAPLPWQQNRTAREERGYDPVENACAPLPLKEYVLQQARLILNNGDCAVAEYVLASLNNDGLIDLDPEEAARTLGVPVERLHSVLSRLQTLDPSGVCARSAQESILAQLQELSSETPVPPGLEAIIREHWRDLANHAYEKIAKRVGLSPPQVEEAVAFMRTHLCPYPGRLYHPPHTTQEGDTARFIRPDVVIRKELDTYIVEIVHSFDFELRVSEAYSRLCATARVKAEGSAEYAQAVEHYRRAVWLLRSLQFREQTLRQIAEYAVEYQRSYLDTSNEDKMKLLTRTQVAAYIGKQVSTVSRAIANKFVLLPNGELVPLAKLFSPAIAPKTIVAELLSNENPDDPLTDEKIARILRIRGFNIARRTVAKYRLALRLPSSIQRGRH